MFLLKILIIFVLLNNYKMDKLLKDEIVICVINAKANLTQFKEYKVLSASYAS